MTDFLYLYTHIHHLHARFVPIAWVRYYFTAAHTRARVPAYRHAHCGLRPTPAVHHCYLTHRSFMPYRFAFTTTLRYHRTCTRYLPHTRIPLHCRAARFATCPPPLPRFLYRRIPRHLSRALRSLLPRPYFRRSPSARRTGVLPPTAVVPPPLHTPVWFFYATRLPRYATFTCAHTHRRAIYLCARLTPFYPTVALRYYLTAHIFTILPTHLRTLRSVLICAFTTRTAHLRAYMVLTLPPLRRYPLRLPLPPFPTLPHPHLPPPQLPRLPR